MLATRLQTCAALCGQHCMLQINHTHNHFHGLVIMQACHEVLGVLHGHSAGGSGHAGQRQHQHSALCGLPKQAHHLPASLQALVA